MKLRTYWRSENLTPFRYRKGFGWGLRLKIFRKIGLQAQRITLWACIWSSSQARVTSKNSLSSLCSQNAELIFADRTFSIAIFISDFSSSSLQQLELVWTAPVIAEKPGYRFIAQLQPIVWEDDIIICKYLQIFYYRLIMPSRFHNPWDRVTNGWLLNRHIPNSWHEMPTHPGAFSHFSSSMTCRTIMG